MAPKVNADTIRATVLIARGETSAGGLAKASAVYRRHETPCKESDLQIVQDNGKYCAFTKRSVSARGESCGRKLSTFGHWGILVAVYSFL
jgi:hypothetical protein